MFAEQISDPDLEAPRPTINDSGDEGDLPALGETLPRTEPEGDFADTILVCEAIQQGDRDVPSDNLLSIGDLSRCDGSRGRLELSPSLCIAWLILNRHLDRPYERCIFLRFPKPNYIDHEK